MTQSRTKTKVNRRDFLKRTGSLATGAAVLGKIAPVAYAREDNTIRLALIGCGGRGNGAVGDALNVKNEGPVKLYAMADLYRNKIDSSQTALQKRFGVSIRGDDRIRSIRTVQDLHDYLIALKAEA